MAGTESYVLRSSHGRYLEHVPHSDTWEWIAGDERHATPMSRGMAESLAQALTDDNEVTVLPDYYGRTPIDHG